jgi:hypothetical protein
MSEKTKGTLYLDSWAGRIGYPVEICGEKGNKYRIRTLGSVRIHRKLRLAGDVFLVPKTAVRIEG